MQNQAGTIRRCIPATTCFITIFLCLTAARAIAEPPRPNVVVIYTDDMGYGDLSGFGATGLKTPNLDHIAEQGAKFTHFYNSSSACCTSRASLLTGAYHQRLGMRMLGPDSAVGLNPEEVTIAEMLKDAGY